MQNLLSLKGEAALATVMESRPLLAFDFDGTLAPIVSRPHDAHVSVAVARPLELLSRVLPVAIITGRQVADVVPRLGFEPGFIIGNHGAEDPEGAPAQTDAGAALDPLRQRLLSDGAALRAAGVDVEDKGFSIALHYRLAGDRARAVDVIAAAVQGAEAGTRVFGGKCVVNVVADDAPDKADAVERLVERCGAASAVFVGDDVNDEPVFIRAQPHWLTVRVGRDDPASQARYFVDGTPEVGIMLQRMLALA